LAAKIFLPKMAAIVSRGRITHEYLATLKLNNVTAGADYAFSLEVTSVEAAAAKKKFDPSSLKNKKVVGVSPSVVMQKKVDGKGGNYAKSPHSLTTSLKRVTELCWCHTVCVLTPIKPIIMTCRYVLQYMMPLLTRKAS
jgi:polysaccharide pyruvyl transferase WcaK-like protein